MVEQACQGSNPDQRGWSSRCCRLHHRPVLSLGVKRTTRVERASPGWRPGALPSELRPRRRKGASGRSRTHTSAVQRARAAVDTTEARVETVGVEPTSSSLQARCSSDLSYIPRRKTRRTGGVEPPQPRRQGYSLLSSPRAQRPRTTKGGRPGSNRRRRGSQPRVLPTTPRPPRAGTTGLEPAASRLTSERSLSSELHPR